MHSRLLRHFLKVVERRTITGAADALNISQPALTRSIRQLEKTIGVELFERLPTGVVLTRQGEALARRAKLMELEYRHALAEIAALEQGLAGVLRIGAGPVWITSILPGIVAEFHRQFPKVKIQLTSGVIDTLFPALLEGATDIVCSTLDFPNQPEIVKEPMIRVRHAVVARAAHPLAGRGVVEPQDLAQYAWLTLAFDHVGVSRLGSYFAANALEPPEIAAETTSLGIMKILQEDDFLALFPERMLPDVERQGLVRVPIEGTFWESAAGIAYRRSMQPLRTIESFKAILRANMAD
jgi:DNA-binding transcriptional LysR family regulator